MNPAPPASPVRLILTVNGGSSSLKFAGFVPGRGLRPLWRGEVRKIGARGAELRVQYAQLGPAEHHTVAAPNHRAAADLALRWIRTRHSAIEIAAVGHRIVHGGARHWRPRRLTPRLLADLARLSPFDPDHMPAEIMLARKFQRAFPRAVHCVCFDTAFHHDLPNVAQLLPIPRRYHRQGLRRYGFHGLSCEHLVAELARTSGSGASTGRVILAHLGNGASLTAVRDGRSMDTSMGFTPASGLVMSTRAGDLDPGLGWYLARTERLTPHRFHQMVSRESGLLGISGTSADMAVLLAREQADVRAAEAVAVFCHQARKWLCAMAGVLGGVDTVVFSGGIGENAAAVRERICAGLDFLGLRLDGRLNRNNAPVISAAGSPVSVRVMRTDEEQVIARHVLRLLKKT